MIGFMYHPLNQLTTSLNRELCKFCTGIMPNKNVEWTVLRGVVIRSNDIDNITDRHNNTHRITGRQGHRPATTNVFCSALFSFLDEIFLVFRTYLIFLFLRKSFHFTAELWWLLFNWCSFFYGCILFHSPDSVKIIQDIKTLSLWNW